MPGTAAANGIAPAESATIYLRVDQAPSITSADHATFRTGVADSFTVTASGYPDSTFSKTGALPTGVTLSPSGVLSGTPAYGRGGLYHITLAAANGVGSPVTQAFTLAVDQPPGFHASLLHLTFRAGHWRRLIFYTTGFPTARVSKSGRLPRGIHFRALAHGAAKLSGRAARSARHHRFRIVLKARNGVGAAARLVLIIRVR